MPYFWMTMPNDEPEGRTDEIRRIVEEAGGRLVDDEAFYDQGGPLVYALTDGPDDFAKARAMARALGARSMRVLLTTKYAQDAYDYERQLKPPPDGSTGA